MKIKNKIISIFLSCFLFVNSSVSSFANPIAFTPQIIGTVATILVASGVVLQSNDDVLDAFGAFYFKNKENWSDVQQLFDVGVSIGKDKVVTVGKEFLNCVLNTFDDIMEAIKYSTTKVYKFSPSALPIYPAIATISKGQTYDYGDFHISLNESGYTLTVYEKKSDGSFGYLGSAVNTHTGYFAYTVSNGGKNIYAVNRITDTQIGTSLVASPAILSTKPIDIMSLPLNGYDKGLINSNTSENGSVGLYVPGNLSDLTGVTSPQVFPQSGNPPYDLPVGGVVVPGDVVGEYNPGYVLDDSVAFPGEVGDTPTDTPTDTPGDITFPSFGDSIDFTPLEATGITEKFPFSLPWDIGRLLNIFNVSPVAPYFELPILGQKIVIDFTDFDEWANITRFFVQISFIGMLIFISTRLKG